MKKIFTLMGLATLSYGINAQTSTILLSEDFSDGSMHTSLTSNNPSSVNDGSVILQFNSVDLLSVILQYTPNPNAQTADSISITYDVSFVNTSGGFDTGNESLYYVDSKESPVIYGSTTKYNQLYLQGQDLNVSNAIVANKIVTVSKGFNAPFDPKLNLIDFTFEKTYVFEGITASSPETLAATVCPLYSSNSYDLEHCIGELMFTSPTIQGSLRIDNIVITSHKVTGLEGSIITKATPVKAFNLLGKEIEIDTKNEAIIVIYSDGSSVREYKTR